MSFGGIILAGGLNTRIRINKAFLAIGNEPIVQRIIEVLKPLVADIIIVANQPGSYNSLGVQVVTDIIPQRGPLSGIHAGLKASRYQYNFVVACDMPFLEPSLISYLLECSPGFDVVVPRMGNYLQPLHAVYSRVCFQPIEENLLANRRQIISFYDKVRVKYVDVDRLLTEAELNRMFFNINTRCDYEQAKRLWKQTVTDTGNKSSGRE